MAEFLCDQMQKQIGIIPKQYDRAKKYREDVRRSKQAHEFVFKEATLTLNEIKDHMT